MQPATCSSGCNFELPRNPEAWRRCRDSKLDLKRLLPTLLAEIVVQRCDMRQLSQLTVAAAVLTLPISHQEHAVDIPRCSMDVSRGPVCHQRGLQLGQEDAMGLYWVFESLGDKRYRHDRRTAP